MNFIKFITSLVIPNKVSCCLVSYFLWFKITWACALFTLLYKRLKNCNFQASSGYQYQREHEAYRSLHCRLFIYSNINIPHVKNMLSVGEKTTVTLSPQAYCFPNIIPVQLKKEKEKEKEREKNLPLQWPLESMVTLLHSFDLGYEPFIIKSNKIPYLEDRINFLNNLDLDILFMKFSYLYFMLFVYSCWSSND